MLATCILQEHAYLFWFLCSLFGCRTKKIIAKQTHLAMRSIGDGLLKLNEDFSTPVPPIQKLSSETFGLTFDSPVFIDPDSLVGLSLKFLNADIARRTIINVRDVKTGEMVYGFEIDHLEQKEIPCLGRVLAKSDYSIEFSFFDDPTTQLLYSNIPALGTAGVSLFFYGFRFFIYDEKETCEKKQWGNPMEWNQTRFGT